MYIETGKQMEPVPADARPVAPGGRKAAQLTIIGGTATALRRRRPQDPVVADLAPAAAEPERVPAATRSALFRMLRQGPGRWMMFTATVDALLLMAALAVATRLRYVGDAVGYETFAQHQAARGLLFAGAILLCMLALGLYQPQTRDTRLGLFIRQMVGFGLGTALLVIVYYLLPQAYVGRGVFGIASALGLGAVALWRVVVVNLMDAEMLQRRVLIFGAGERAAFVAQRMRRRSDRQTFSVVGFVPVAGEAVQVPVDQLVDVKSRLCAWARSRQIDEIVVVPDDRRGSLPMNELLECRQGGIEVSDLVRFLERESGKVKLNTPPSWLVFSEGFNASPLRQAIKRMFDLVAAAVMLVAGLPVMLLVALAIRLESGRGQPVLYFQERVGQGGRPFRLYKFRSMRTDAEAGGVARWASKDDDRVTRVGRVIRKLRLDELPQLWNVLRGSMSLIGPRPERPQFVAELSRVIPYYTLRHCVKPGITGWAQLRYPYGSSVDDAAEKLTFDLYYAKNQSLKFDLLIFLQTVEVVLFGRGAR